MGEEELQPIEEPVGEETEEAVPTEEEGAYAPVAEEPQKPKSDVYTAMLVLSILLFGVSIAMAWMEVQEFYWKP